MRDPSRRSWSDRYQHSRYKPWAPYVGCGFLVLILFLLIMFIGLLPPPF